MSGMNDLINSTVADQYVLERLMCQARTVCLFEASRRQSEAASGFSSFGVKFQGDSNQIPERGLLVLASCDDGAEQAHLLNHWRQWKTRRDPSLITCHDTAAIIEGPFQGGIYAYTEFGVTLGAALSDGELGRDEALRALQSVARGLASLHSQGICHGGVSAGNIINVDGEWKLAPSPSLGRSNLSAADDVYALAGAIAFGLTNPHDDPLPDSYSIPWEQLADMRQRLEAVVDDPWRTLLLRALDPVQEQRPSAATLSEDPGPMPQPVGQITVQREGSNCTLTWQSPANGTVRLVKSSDVSTIQENTLFLATDIRALGEIIPISGPDTAQLTLRGDDPVAVIPVTERGILATTGQAEVIGSLEDVTIRDADIDRGEVVLHLRWPTGVQNALIVMRPDKYPEGPNDLHATPCPSPRGNRIQQAVRLPVHSWAKAFITVYSFENVGGRLVYSPGTTANSRCSLDVSSHRRIEYSVIARRSLPFASANVYELRISTDVAMDLPALVLVGKRGRISPAHRSDGEPLVVTSAGEVCDQAPLVFEFEGLQRPFAVRLFPRDDKLAQWLQLRFVSKLVFD